MAAESLDILVVDDADGLALRAGPLRIDQALANLLENARPCGGGQVELVAESRDGAVRQHVRDYGPASG